MGIPLTAIAGAFDQLAKQSAKFDQIEDQRRMLALELQRTAPQGYQVAGGPDGRPTLKYVGMQDPRIQTQLAAQRAELSQQNDAKLAMARQLQPIEMANAETEARLRSQLQIEQLKAAAIFEQKTAFNTAAAQLVNPNFPTLPPHLQALTQGDVAGKLAALQGMDPTEAQHALNQLPEQARAILGQGTAAGSTGQPAQEAPPAGPRTLGAPAPEPAPSQPAPAPPRATQGPSQAAQPSFAPVLEGLREKIRAGVAPADAGNEAFQLLMAQGQQQAVQTAGFPSLKGVPSQVMTESEAMRLVGDTIRSIEAERDPRNALDKRKAELEGKQLDIEEGEMATPGLERALLTTPEDRQAPLAMFDIEEPTKEDQKAGRTREARVNKNALVEAGRGNAEPIERIRKAANAHGLSTGALAELPVLQAFTKQAQAEIDQFQPRRTGKAGEVMLLTPQKGLALAVDSQGTLRVTGGQDRANSAIGKRVEAIGEQATAGVNPRTGNPIQRPAKPVRTGEEPGTEIGLTPQGIAELVWAAAHAPGVEDRSVPRFVWINAPIRGLSKDQQDKLAINNQQVFRAMGKAPKQTGGVWLDIETLLAQ